MIRLRQYLLVLLALGCCSALWAQQGEEYERILQQVRQANLDSLLALEETEQHCVFLDASQAVDSLVPQLQFEWEFAIGDYRRGQQVEYCYDTPGEKLIALSVVDPIHQTRQARDTIIRIYCPPRQLPFQVEGNRLVQSSLTFTVPDEVQADTNLAFVWQFDRNPLRIGTRVSQFFNRQGQYQVTLYQVVRFPRPVVLSAYRDTLVIRSAGPTQTIIQKGK